MTQAALETAHSWNLTQIAPFIGAVMQKMEQGVYATEAVRCFCGADFDDTPIVERDRYLMPHRMVLCRQCSLIRATPRMTADAYTSYYNTEYRPIYDGWQYGARADDTDYRFMRQRKEGIAFQEFLDYFNVHPQTVVDIGCNMGGLLMPFKERGLTVYGAEICDSAISYGTERGIPIIRGGIDAIAERGIKADLVVMEDVIEHLLDLRQLERLHDILNPVGYLYVGTPGLFHTPLNVVWQNAHVWQFVAETLHYVMGCLGFEALYLDEDIVSLWGRVSDHSRMTVKKPSWYRPYIIEHLQQKKMRRIPPIRCVNKFTVKERIENIDRNLSYKFPDVRALFRTQSGPVVVVGGGPSVDAELPKIQRMVNEQHYPLMVIDRMYPWAVANGMTPTYVVVLDASDDVDEGFTAVQPETVHLLSSAIHSKIFDLLKDHRAYVFNGHNPYMAMQDVWHKHGYEKVSMLNTGGSVAICSVAMAAAFGYRQIELFGFDCKVGEKEYASGIAGKSVERNYLEVEIDGKTFSTCLPFLSFAQQFLRLVSDLKQGKFIEGITVHGDSLINEIWDQSCAAENATVA